MTHSSAMDNRQSWWFCSIDGAEQKLLSKSLMNVANPQKDLRNVYTERFENFIGKKTIYWL